MEHSFIVQLKGGETMISEASKAKPESWQHVSQDAWDNIVACTADVLTCRDSDALLEELEQGYPQVWRALWLITCVSVGLGGISRVIQGIVFPVLLLLLISAAMGRYCWVLQQTRQLATKKCAQLAEIYEKELRTMVRDPRFREDARGLNFQVLVPPMHVHSIWRGMAMVRELLRLVVVPSMEPVAMPVEPEEPEESVQVSMKCSLSIILDRATGKGQISETMMPEAWARWTSFGPGVEQGCWDQLLTKIHEVLAADYQEVEEFAQLQQRRRCVLCAFFVSMAFWLLFVILAGATQGNPIWVVLLLTNMVTSFCCLAPVLCYLAHQEQTKTIRLGEVYASHLRRMVERPDFQEGRHMDFNVVHPHASTLVRLVIRQDRSHDSDPEAV